MLCLQCLYIYVMFTMNFQIFLLEIPKMQSFFKKYDKRKIIDDISILL